MRAEAEYDSMPSDTQIELGGNLVDPVRVGRDNKMWGLERFLSAMNSVDLCMYGYLYIQIPVP